MTKKVSHQRRRLGRISFAAFEGLEQRQHLSAAPSIKFSAPTFYFNDIESSASGGSGASPSQSLSIRNAGNATLTIPANGITLGGTNANEFTANSTGSISIAPGATKTVSLAFNANALGVQTATLSVKSNDTKHSPMTINLRGLGTAGAGGNLEPSLQRILDLFQIPDKVGEPHPDQTAFPVPPSTPNDEVQMQTMVKAGSGSVSISLLAVFDNFKTPATDIGTYTPGSASSTKQLFSVPNQNDAQSVHPTISGSTSFDPGTSAFGIYTVFPAFSNRHTYSQDALNTWETVPANRKKIRFYPLKNADGSVVPNAFIFAAEDYNKAYDFNDVVGIIRNVKAGPGASSGGGSTGSTTTSSGSSTGNISAIAGLSVQNLDLLPANDRVVFDRISNPDEFRTNVTHNIASVKLTNTTGASMTISSIATTDGNFIIDSGGGTNITLGAGQSRTVTMEFVGAGTGSSILKVFQSNLKITVGSTSDVVVLEGLWQAYSEQTPANPSHLYDEPSLTTIINTIFGYKTDIANAGQSKTEGDLVMLGTHGDRTAVGDEVLSDYWTSADGGSVTVRMLAAFHRQNNFDPTTGDPITAASSVRWFPQGSSTSTTSIFVHNINEGQSLLPHINNSTTKPAEGSFSPGAGKPFGFKVDSKYSDDALNASDFNPSTNVPYANTGHSFRFYPLIDENGNVVPNTYIMAMDYTGLSYSNYDYQDNIYIVSNIMPASKTSAGFTALSLSSSSNSSLFSSTAVSNKDSGSVIDDGGPMVL